MAPRTTLTKYRHCCTRTRRHRHALRPAIYGELEPTHLLFSGCTPALAVENGLQRRSDLRLRLCRVTQTLFDSAFGWCRKQCEWACGTEHTWQVAETKVLTARVVGHGPHAPGVFAVTRAQSAQTRQDAAVKCLLAFFDGKPRRRPATTSNLLRCKSALHRSNGRGQCIWGSAFGAVHSTQIDWMMDGSSTTRRRAHRETAHRRPPAARRPRALIITACAPTACARRPRRRRPARRPQSRRSGARAATPPAPPRRCCAPAPSRRGRRRRRRRARSPLFFVMFEVAVQDGEREREREIR